MVQQEGKGLRPKALRDQDKEPASFVLRQSCFLKDFLGQKRNLQSSFPLCFYFGLFLLSCIQVYSFFLIHSSQFAKCAL